MFMFDEYKRKFLFRCEDCKMIISIDLEEEQDLEEVVEGRLVLDCPCGGRSFVLRN